MAEVLEDTTLASAQFGEADSHHEMVVLGSYWNAYEDHESVHVLSDWVGLLLLVAHLLLRPSQTHLPCSPKDRVVVVAYLCGWVT